MSGAIAHAPVLMQVAGLAKRYRDQNALADISFAVNAGEVLGLIGPNGAGKTTLMEAIAGLIPADDGRVLWRGAPLPLRQRRECMFYLPDGLRPWEDQYVARVIGLFTAAYGRSEGFVAGIVRVLGLAPVLAKRVHALSKGYSRRLMLAVGLLTPHPLLLMDEPFDGFDLRQTREIMGVFRRAGSGRTLVLAIHQLSMPNGSATALCLLADGRVRGAGTLDELRARTAAPRWRTGGGVPCAHLRQRRSRARPSARCSPRSCGKSSAAARCGRCCSSYARWSAIAFSRPVSLYGEASSAARDRPRSPAGFRRLTACWCRRFGALYVAVTLLFPFVAIRVLGREKESGALRLLVQLPYRIPTLIAAKMTAILLAWLICGLPAISALAIWAMLGGHLSRPRDANLSSATCSMACWSAPSRCSRRPLSDSSATAAIIALAFTIGSWVLDFALAGQPGVLAWISRAVADADAAYLRAGAAVGRSRIGHRRRDRRLCCARRGMAASRRAAASQAHLVDRLGASW